MASVDKRKEKKMKSGGGRVKGHNFERQICNVLRDAWKIELERTPLSGGWGKMQTGGDIVGKEGFPLYIECRKHESWNLDQLFKDKGLLWTWWNEVIGKAEEEGKIPILIFSRNHAPIYVMCWLFDYSREKIIASINSTSGNMYFVRQDVLVVLLENFVEEYEL